MYSMKIVLRFIVLFAFSLLLFAGQSVYACEMHDANIEKTSHTIEKSVNTKILSVASANHDSGCCAHGVSICCMTYESCYIAFHAVVFPKNGRIHTPFDYYYSLTLCPEERPPAV